MKKSIVVLFLIIISSTIGVNKVQSQDIKTNKCAFYFDNTIEKWICINYDIPPKFLDNVSLTNVLDRIIIPEDFLDENNEFVYIIPFTLIITIDADGRVLSYEMSEKRKNRYTAYEKIVIRAFETEMQWTPAQCAGVNVASRHSLPLNIHHHIEIKKSGGNKKTQSIPSP